MTFREAEMQMKDELFVDKYELTIFKCDALQRVVNRKSNHILGIPSSCRISKFDVAEA
jgi:hypothetical protein